MGEVLAREAYVDRSGSKMLRRRDCRSYADCGESGSGCIESCSAFQRIRLSWQQAATD